MPNLILILLRSLYLYRLHKSADHVDEVCIFTLSCRWCLRL